MSDIPLVINDKGDVLGWDGKAWRPPDDVAQNDRGRKAYRFGDKWQIEPMKGEKGGTAAEAGVVLSGAAKGLADSLNPANLATAAIRANPFYAALGVGEGLARGDMAAPGLEAATQPMVDASSKFAQKVNLAKAAINAGPTGLLQKAYPQIEGMADRLPGGPEAIADYANVEMTPGLKIASRIAEGAGAAAGSFLPFGMAAAARSGPALTKAGRFFVDPIKAAPKSQFALNLGVGATSGLGQGVGEAVAGPEGRLPGALLGMGLPIAGLAGINALSKMPALATVKKSGPETLATRMFAESITDPKKALAALDRPPPVKGPFTLGQRTGDPGALHLERMAEGQARAVLPGESANFPGMALPTAFKSAKESVKRSIADEVVRPLAPIDDPLAASQNLGATARGAYETAKLGERKAWDAFRAASGDTWERAPLLKAMADHIDSIGIDAADLPKDLVNRLKLLPKNLTLDDLKKLNSKFTSAASEAARAGNFDKARVISEARSVLRTFQDDLPNVPPQAMDAYTKARGMTRDVIKGQFEDTPIGGIFDRSGTNLKAKVGSGERYNYDIPSSAVGQKTVGTGPGSIERIEALLKIGDPKTIQAGREYWASNLWKYVKEGSDDTVAPNIQAARLRDFLKASRSTTSRLYKDNAGKKLIEKMDAAADMVARAAPPAQAGTDTATKLASQGRTFFDGLLLRALRIPTGGMSEKVAVWLSERTSNEVWGLIGRATLDPDGFGRQLLRKANDGSFVMMERGLRRAVDKINRSITPSAAPAGLLQDRSEERPSPR